MLRATAILVACASAYGFTIGYAHSTLYAVRNLVKLPLLLLGTAAVCALSYGVLARFVTDRIGFAAVQRLALQLFRDLSVLLSSLATVNGFLAGQLHGDDDPSLGEYPLFLGVNMLLVAVCGALALIRQARELLERYRVPRPRARALVAAWLFTSLLVGGQGAFYLRPFFGLPASRGGHPPFCVGNEPDVRGATNFFEVLWQFVSRPPVPEGFGSAR